MATRSNIAIILKEEDKAIVFAEPNERLEESGIRLRYGVDNGNVLQIYCHWDGYPEGVGQDLLDDFNSYDEALKLILEGDHSTPMNHILVAVKTGCQIGRIREQNQYVMKSISMCVQRWRMEDANRK